MKQENKQLLLVDLSARLPYGVKMNHIADVKHQPDTLIGLAKDMITLQSLCGYSTSDIEDYKPYLFPLSSMTKEQRNEFLNIQSEERKILFNALVKYRYEEEDKLPIIPLQKHIDWLNANHFDFRNLIGRGLAIDCTNLNIY